MVEKFREILRSIVAAHADVYLFALLQMDEFIDKWSVIVSAPWIDDSNRQEVFEEIRHLMVTHLSAEEIVSIARLGIFNRDEHLISELLKLEAGARIEDQPINGNIVHKGHILASNRTLS